MDDQGSRWDDVQWLRINEMKDIEGKPVGENYIVTDKFEANDILQGEVGDCWFLSALSVVSHNRPELLEKLIHYKSRKGGVNGWYVIRFFKARKQRILAIDDRFPCRQDKRSKFCQLQYSGDSVEIWPLLFEKAYAKIHNGYD